MGILIPEDAYGPTPTDRLAVRLGAPGPGADVTAAGQRADEQPGAGRQFLTAFQQQNRLRTFWGSATEAAVYGITGAGLPRGLDPEWRVYDLLRNDPAYLAEHPYMIEDFQSGRVLDFPNAERYYYYEQRKRRDWLDRRELAAIPWYISLPAAVPGQIADALMGGKLLRAAKLGPQMAGAYRWARTGHWAARSGKLAAWGAGANAAQELAIMAAYPDRAADNLHELIQAGIWGGVFAGGIGLAVGGLNGLGRRVSSHRVTKVQTRIAALLNDTKITAARAPIADAVEAGRKELDGLLARPKRAAPDAAPARPTPGEPTSLTVLDTPETRPLIDRVKAQFGDDVVFMRHPLQDIADTTRMLTSLSDSLEAVRPVDPVGAAKLAKPYSSLLGAVAPGARLRGNPSALARQALHWLADDSLATRDSAARPLTHTVRPSASSIKYNLDTDLYRAEIAVLESWRGIRAEGRPIHYTFADGRTAAIHGAWWRRGDHRAFHEAITDYRRRLAEAPRRGQPAPDAPAPVRKAAAAVDAYYQQMGAELQRAKMIGPDIELDPLFGRRRWVAWKVRENHDGFTRRLVANAKRYREIDFETGKRLTPDERALVADVIDSLPEADRAAIRKAAADAGADALTEGRLRQVAGDAALQRYLAEVDRWIEGRAEATFATIAEMDGRAVGGGRGGRPPTLRRRVLTELDETDFSDFLENDVVAALDDYHHQVAGRTAVRQAVAEQMDIWEPIVKELTGKNLGDSYDPDLVLSAIRRDFQRWRDLAAAKGDATLMKTIDRGENSAMKIIESKLMELQEIPVEGANGAYAGLGSFLSRNLLRTTYMAQLGRVGLSQIPDSAGLQMYRHLNAPRVRTLRRMLRMMGRVPNDQLAGFHAAVSDVLHSQRAMNLGLLDSGSRRPFGPGRRGRAMQTADAFTAKAAEKFSRWTGMSLWNRTWKRAAVNMQLHEYLWGARRMAKAAGYMAEGMDEAAAVAKAGLTGQQATRLNRLGLNAERSRRLLDHAYEHGVDFEGRRPWAGNRAAFDAVDDAIFPDMPLLRQTDRDLWNAVSRGVNSEAPNIIVEPTLMSKPLMNQRLLGRIFNQFYMFNISWGNQLAQVASQTSGRQQAAFLSQLFAMGALSDALHNHLSGRRSLDETATLWGENPLGMSYAAVDRSGLTGWLSRPLAVADQLGWGPHHALDNQVSSGRYYQPITSWGQLGPSMDLLARLLDPLQKAARGQQLDIRDYNRLRTTMPFQNLLWFSVFHRMTEAMGVKNPFGRGVGIDPYLTRPPYEAQRRFRPPTP